MTKSSQCWTIPDRIDRRFDHPRDGAPEIGEELQERIGFLFRDLVRAILRQPLLRLGLRPSGDDPNFFWSSGMVTDFRSSFDSGFEPSLDSGFALSSGFASGLDSGLSASVFTMTVLLFLYISTGSWSRGRAWKIDGQVLSTKSHSRF